MGQKIRLSTQALEKSCTTEVIADGAITAEKLSGHGVDTNAIADGAVTTIKINIDDDLDFHLHQILNVRIDNVVSDPVAGNEGRLIYRTDEKFLKIDNGTSWNVVGMGAVAIKESELFIVEDVDNKNFTLLNTPSAKSEMVMLNGLVLTKGDLDDYTISDNVITLSDDVILSIDSKVSVRYEYFD